jgi:hypothetical protein
VAEVALHDVQWDVGIQQARGPGMPETVGALEVLQGASGIADVEPAGQLAEQVPQSSV